MSQLSIFSTDSEKSGFRLQYLEVYNWGTFDETIHAIYPKGETSLLTGSNGSGKTTFVDALLTLIVPEKRYRFYNQSSGSEKKGDRTEDTYVLGGYGTINNESTGTTKTLYLRDSKETAYSIILANFENEAEQAVTLFQVRYFINGDMKRHFGVAHKSLKIEDDFKPFDLGGNWKKALEQRYNKGPKKFVEWFDAASKYAQRLVDVLGMQSIQALHLFNQTVGIKVLGNLDEFIRTHMLEPRNMEEQFQDLKKHLSTLLDARRNIEKVEEQLKMLEPVKENFELFEAAKKQSETLQEILQTANIWYKYSQHELLAKDLTSTNDRQKELTQKIEAQNKIIDELYVKENSLRNQIDQNQAGQRLNQLQKEIETLAEKKAQAAVKLEEFLQWCKTLHITETEISTEAIYQRVKKENEKKQLTIDREQKLNEDDLFESKNIDRTATIEKENIEIELNALNQNRNNIPAYLIEMRKRIADALDIKTDELPFAGELMQVASEHLDWQPSLEKLLRPFALRLLVPDQHYKRVNRFVNRENLRGKLVYEHVLEVALELHPDENTVVEKLEFHPEHPLAYWLGQQIIKQYNYACLNDEKQLDRFERAVTLNGLIKNRQRHEKDDRANQNDPSKYVMGWDNETKKQALFSKRDNLVTAIEKAREIIERCNEKAKRIQKQFVAFSNIKEHSGFEGLDIAGLQVKIHKTEAQVAALTKENQALNNLKQQLEEAIAQKDEQRNISNQYNRELGAVEDKIKAINQQLVPLAQVIELITESEKDALLHFQQAHPSLLNTVDLSNIDTTYVSFKNEKEVEKEKVYKQLTEAERKLNRAMQHIKNPSVAIAQKYPDWVADVVQMPEDPQYANEYIEWMDKMSSENLPKYKKDFENFVNVTITYKIGGLNEELEKWERDISTSVNKLNYSLEGINFNRMPDTFVQLQKQHVAAGSDIREFKNKLLDALPQAANWRTSSFEEKAAHFTQKIMPLITELDTNETYRNKVLDVRNWFEFWADEKFRNNGELKKTYRQMGQLSGGEKAQLTYTILCSAIAYQFGITREGRASRSLRFIAVDESFSNQDEEKATYLMELCKQLHLQLLVVTPSDKIQIVQEFIAHVHLVQRVNNRNSVMYNMTIKELKEKMEKALN